MQYPFLTRASTRHILLAACTALLLGFLSMYAGLIASGAVGPKRTDFLPAYTAAQLVAQGRGGALYVLRQLGHSEAILVHPLVVRDGVMPYLYPPHLAVLMSPLAHLPYGVAFLLWLFVNLGLLLLAGLVVQHYLAFDRSGTLLLWMAIASYLPILVALAQGQVSILLLAVAASALWAFGRGHDLLGGALITGLAVKPTYLLPILLVLIVRTRWRALAGAAGALVAATGLAVLTLGPAILPDYAHMLLSASRWQNQIGGFSPRWNQSLDGLAQQVAPAAAWTAISILLAMVLLVLLARCARRAPSIEIPFAAALVVGLLASPHVLIHDLSLLVIPAAVLWRESTFRLSLRTGIVIFAYLATVFGLPLASVLAGSPAPAALAAMGCCLLVARPRPHLHALPAGVAPALPSLSQSLSLKDCS